MHLTIAMFAQEYRGGDISGHVREIKQFIAWRLDRGLVEWNSKCYYYNTPHISMGSVHSDGGNLQSRYNSVLFGADPSQGLRVELILPDVPSHKRRYEARGRVVQHKNWLLGQGTLFEDGGAKAKKVGQWNVYRVGKGICAQMELADSYHVLQVSDLDTFADEESFVAALSVPQKKGDRVDAVTMDGDRLAVDLTDMKIAINDTPRPHPPKMLHDSDSMKSEYESGRITITTQAGSVTFDAADIRPEPPELAALPKGGFRWGNPVGSSLFTTVAHTRALGGRSPREQGMLLKSVSILVPRASANQIRLAVYLGGTLEGGPHAGTPARLLYDFGKTKPNEFSWITLEHPQGGVPLPADTPVWIAWKGIGGKVHINYQEEPVSQGGFQNTRGRWESKAVESDENAAWQTTWPDDRSGAFADFWYSCYLTLQRTEPPRLDPAGSWVETPWGEPVIDRGEAAAWDHYAVDNPYVHAENGKFYCFFEAQDKPFDRGGREAFGLALSNNGQDWEKLTGNPILNVGPAQAWDSVVAKLPAGLIERNGVYHLFYSGLDSTTKQIGLATARQLTGPWIKSPDNPVIKSRPGQWDAFLSTYPAPVFEADNKFYLLFRGMESRYRRQGAGLAVSDDLHHWRRYTDDPVIPVAKETASLAVAAADGQYVGISQPMDLSQRRYWFSTDLKEWQEGPPVKFRASVGAETLSNPFLVNGRWTVLYEQKDRIYRAVLER